MFANIRLNDVYPGGLPTAQGAPPSTQQASGQVPTGQGTPGLVVVGFIALLVILRVMWEKAK